MDMFMCIRDNSIHVKDVQQFGANIQHTGTYIFPCFFLIVMVDFYSIVFFIAVTYPNILCAGCWLHKVFRRPKPAFLGVTVLTTVFLDNAATCILSFFKTKKLKMFVNVVSMLQHSKP